MGAMPPRVIQWTCKVEASPDSMIEMKHTIKP